jgi:hypothetical protein
MGRDYWLGFPKGYDPAKTYWVVATAHYFTGTGNDLKNFELPGVNQDYIVVSPSYPQSEKDGFYQVLMGQADKQLLDLFQKLKTQYRLHDKMFLYGFSGGAQFSHRFAMAYPRAVIGCSAHSAGTWGSQSWNGPDTSPEAIGIPFFVSCGTDDTQIPAGSYFYSRIAAASFYFDESLLKQGMCLKARFWEGYAHAPSPKIYTLNSECFELATTGMFPDQRKVVNDEIGRIDAMISQGKLVEAKTALTALPTVNLPWPAAKNPTWFPLASAPWSPIRDEQMAAVRPSFVAQGVVGLCTTDPESGPRDYYVDDSNENVYGWNVNQAVKESLSKRMKSWIAELIADREAKLPPSTIVAPAITTPPASITVTAPATATFTVVATGTPAPTYQWRKGGTAISGATAASYTTPATVIGDNGAQFSVVVTNSAGTATSTNATLTVTAAPVAPAITAQPAQQSVLVGQTATFTVVATGTPAPTYQWRKGGTAISGATAASYTTPATVIGDNGAQFSVVVTNSAGTATSANGTLTVTAAPVAPAITAQPAQQSVLVGQTATFTVVATGTPAPTYQWRKGGTAISGATAASYTTPATVIGDNGAQFSVVVTNSAGTATSTNGTLTVTAAPVAPAITAQPAQQSVIVGQTATFTVVATGTPAPTYQWRKGGTAISGATAASYTTPVTVISDNGALFSVVVTNSAGTATSTNGTLTVTAAPVAPAITAQPAQQSVIVGQTATFTVVATGTPAPTYQWRKGGTAISGATAASYTTPVTVISDNGAQFSVVVTNSAGTATSTNGTLTVTAAPVAPAITAQPAQQSVIVGQTATFTVVATGTPAPTYQWRKGGTAISGATAASYTTPVTVISDNGAQFSVVVTNSAGTATSANATLTVQAIPPTNTAPVVNAGVDQAITLPLGATLDGTVTDDGLPGSGLTYAWTTVSGPAAVTFVDSAVVDATVTFSAPGSYVLRLTSSDGAVSVSDDITVTVNAAVPVNTAPVVNAGVDQAITLPDIATLNGTVTDDGLPSASVTHAWSLIAGPDSVTFSTPTSLETSVSFTTAGSYVLRLTVSDGQLTTTDEVTVSVAPAPLPSASALMPPVTSGGDSCAAGGLGVVLSSLAMALRLRRRRR